MVRASARFIWFGYKYFKYNIKRGATVLYYWGSLQTSNLSSRGLLRQFKNLGINMGALERTYSTNGRA